VKFRCCLMAAAVAVVAAAVLGVAHIGLPSPALDRGRDLSVLVLARDGSILRGFLTADDKWRLPLASAIDPLYRRMLVAAEDSRFDSHPGVDPAAMLRAIGQLAANFRVV
jgi:penicillin-binding protein 1C